jgi:hypothetical protein
MSRPDPTLCKQGLLLSPPSALVRTGSHFPDAGSEGWQRYLKSTYFTLQWHVTQACDLHCKHCYDRSTISPLTLDQGITILDQFREFVLEQKGIRKILCHLTLWVDKDIRGSPCWPGKRMLASVLQKQERHYEPIDDGWLGYEDPTFDGD